MTRDVRAEEFLTRLKEKERDLDDRIKKGVEQLAEIQRQGELARELQSIKGDLRRASAFEFILLETNDSKAAEIHNTLASGPFKLKFNTKSLGGSRFDLTITADGRSPQIEPFLTQGDTRFIEIARNEGLAFDVVAVRHRKLGYDFVILKVYYKNRGPRSDSLVTSR